jgi:hypothetical protein
MWFGEDRLELFFEMAEKKRLKKEVHTQFSKGRGVVRKGSAFFIQSLSYACLL